MNKNTKIALILGGLCAVALVVALIVFIPKNNTPEVPTDTTQDSTQNVDPNPDNSTTNDDKISSDVPIVNPTRTDGNISVPMIVNGSNVGKINLVVKDLKFNFPIDELASLNIATLEKQDGIYVYETDDNTYKVSADDVIIITKSSKKDDKPADDKKEENNESKLGAKGYITIEGKDYLTEDAFVCLFYGYVNNKAVSIGEVAARENSWRIEEFLRDESKVEATTEDITKVAEAISGLSNAFVVSSTSVVKDGYSNSEIKDLLYFSLVGEGNYSNVFKKDNQILILFNNNVASAIMNSVLGSISEHDVYTNIRVLVTLDENGKVTDIKADTYYIFDARDIYYYINMMN